MAASSLTPEIKARWTELKKEGGKQAIAKAVGELVGKRAVEAGIKKIAFDRGGYKYHGRVKALAEGARAAGLEF